MSMISAQCDRLRKLADKLESYDQGYGKICVALRQAADTICELRDDLQRANAENAKLRNLVEALLQCAGETKRDKGCDACPMWTEIYEDDYLRYSSCMLGPTLKEIGIEWK